MENTKWDYYDEKLLKSLVIQYTFDFQKISEFFNKNIKHKAYTPEDCRRKWTQMAQKKADSRSRFEDLIENLPQKRVAKDFLKVTERDLQSERSLQNDGSFAYPNGNALGIYFWRLKKRI